MNSKYDKIKLLNFVEFYTNYMENILYKISHKKRKKNLLEDTNILKIKGYKSLVDKKI